MEAVDWLIPVCGFAVLAYTAMLGRFIRSLLGPWQGQQHPDEAGITGLSIIVPYRNEANKLPELVNRLRDMAPAGEMPTEVIFVDDHSTDGYRPSEGRGLPFLYVKADEGKRGKKSAVDVGVQKANHPWLLSLDAGSRPAGDMLKRLSLLRPGNRRLFTFVIRPMPRNGWASKFFDLEFLALQGIGLAIAKRGHAILANGAAMLFSKEAYLAVRPQRRDWHLSSGDDVFLLAAIKGQFGAEAVAPIDPGTNTYMNAQFPKNFRALFTQRLRWISKNASVPDIRFRAVASLSLLANICWIIAIITAWISHLWAPLVILVLMKVIAEATVLYRMACFSDRRDTIPWILPAQIIYPFYLCILVAFGFFTRGRFIND